MKPFVGEKWGEINKILLIGESHSLEGLADEKTIKDWYIKEAVDLTKEQIDNISTEKLIKKGLSEENFGKNRIYSEINNVIQEVDKKLNMNFFSFMNFYQRPVIKKDEIFDKKDISAANETINEVIRILNPDYIFFLSSSAWEGFNIESDNMKIFDNKRIGYSCHPTCNWWNRESSVNLILIGMNKEKNTGKMTFKKFIEIATQKRQPE